MHDTTSTTVPTVCQIPGSKSNICCISSLLASGSSIATNSSSCCSVAGTVISGQIPHLHSKDHSPPLLKACHLQDFSCSFFDQQRSPTSINNLAVRLALCMSRSQSHQQRRHLTSDLYTDKPAKTYHLDLNSTSSLWHTSSPIR